jgi:electron transfer flavoprotein alpha subunit
VELGWAALQFESGPTLRAPTSADEADDWARAPAVSAPLDIDADRAPTPRHLAPRSMWAGALARARQAARQRRGGAAAAAARLAAEAARLLSTLVLAEQKAGVLHTNTLHAVTAARALGGPITVLVAGHGVGDAAAAAGRAAGVDAVLAADDACLARGLAEPVAALLAEAARRRGFSHVVAPASAFGRSALPRAAALLDAQAVADVVQVVDADTFVRPIYAGNALATVRCLGAGPRCLTARPAAFPAAAATGGAAPAAEPAAEEELAAARGAAGGAEWLAEDAPASARPELGQARVVVAGGRALRSAEAFAALGRLADRLGGAVGASRAAVDAGYAPNDLQVGQTGKVVAPDLYIAIGISGAIQHVAGMKDSKVVVAINSDAEAPIFAAADYGLVGDLFEILPALEAALDAAGPAPPR